MNRGRIPAAALGLATALAVAAAMPADAEEKKIGWADTAEFSYVNTSGNAETSTLGFKNKLTRTWVNALLTFNAGAIRADARTPRRIAVELDPDGDPNTVGPIDVIDGPKGKTAENYFLNGRYDRNITKRFFWNAGAGWERNEFAGVKNRYTVIAGLGNIWIESERTGWRTTYAATYTNQKDVVDNPDLKDTFFGGRATSEFSHRFGEITTFRNAVIVDENFSETKDLRGDMVNSVQVALSQHLALKVSHEVLYDNLPSFEDLKVVKVSTGAPDTIPYELDRFDMIFTTSLVVNF